MPVSIISHQDKQIILIDYKPCKNKEEMIATAREAASLFKQQPGKVLAVSDFTGTYGSEEYMNEVKKLSVEVFRAKTEKAAAIGITGIKKVLLKSFNAFSVNKLKPFDTMEDALDYLVS
ncbi:hypothetical protein [Marinoscillum sp.]|uniref:hypothetical protein n=1 Tax=Marinoscillum sp. TaxID=2024838 RepID=UPI003BACFF9A